MSAGTRATRKLTSDVLFCFPGLRFDVFSPYRDGRYCSAPKPGKEKQKSYNYCSAVMMVHRFRFFLSVFAQVMRKIRREVTRKLAAQFEPLPPSPRLGAKVFERKRDFLCCPGLLGKYSTFPKVQLIATAKQAAMPSLRKQLASFDAFARRPCDAWAKP